MTETDIVERPFPTGYATHDEYFATQLLQGGRTVYSIDLSLPQLINTIPRPDPEEVLEGNRRITASRAKAFARYIRERPNYVCPSLLVRAPLGEFRFESTGEVPGGTTFGVLSVPRLARQSVKIIDGQHRVLGFHILWDDLDEDLQKAREHRAHAQRVGDRELTQEWERRVTDYSNERDRLAVERVRVDIVIVDDPKDYKQVFFDIADNQKGISGAVKARFDSTKVVNRALEDVLRHPLLTGRVNEESDRTSKDSPYLLGAKHVAEIIRAVQVGATGRIGRRQETELQDATVVREAMSFLDLLIDAFPLLDEVKEGTRDPAELRRVSVLGSSTMLRVLAGVHHFLTAGDDDNAGWTRDEVKSFFEKLASHLDAPVEADSVLLTTSCFVEGASAPSARQGDVAKLQAELVGWAREGLLE